MEKGGCCLGEGEGGKHRRWEESKGTGRIEVC